MRGEWGREGREEVVSNLFDFFGGGKGGGEGGGRGIGIGNAH